MIVGCVAILIIASLFTFLFVEAKTMHEHVIGAYFTIALLGTFCSFIHTFTTNAALFVVMDCDIDEIIKKSKFSNSEYQFSMASRRHSFHAFEGLF